MQVAYLVCAPTAVAAAAAADAALVPVGTSTPSGDDMFQSACGVEVECATSKCSAVDEVDTALVLARRQWC